MDPRSGYSAETKTYHSLRRAVPLPPSTTPLSAASYSLSLQLTSPFPANSSAFIDSDTGHCISYTDFTRLTANLAASLRHSLHLSKGQTAFILSPNTTRIPILYFSLLSLGVIVSPSNPINTLSDISRQIKFCKATIAFATSQTRHKISGDLLPTIIDIDSPEFESMMKSSTSSSPPAHHDREVVVNQSDVAAVLYSSGTTGQVKGVMLTHRNLIAIVGNYYYERLERNLPNVVMYTAPYFHVIGFFYCLKSVGLSETAVVMARFDLRNMCGAMQRFKVTDVLASPPVVVAMVKERLTEEFDLKSLEMVGSGGAPLGKDVIRAFTAKFPGVLLFQGYGMTETAGAVFRAIGADESLRWGSVGKLEGNCEARIVNPVTNNDLPYGKEGELWIRGPLVMKGYIGNEKATAETLVADGWLRTGDLCYFDNEGFLFVVDRLKELIKYKAYQVPPAELEQLLQSHPDIVDVGVIPYPDEDAGEVPLACVVKRPQSSIDESQVIDFVAKQVAPYKKIRRVLFVKSIPKSAAGKILRKDLRKIAASQVPLSKL